MWLVVSTLPGRKIKQSVGVVIPNALENNYIKYVKRRTRYILYAYMYMFYVHDMSRD